MKKLGFSLVLFGYFICTFQAGAITIDFEAVPDSTEVGDFYASSGIHFADAVALTAGISLNEFDYPPHSGSVAVADDGSPIIVTFDQPVGNISAWFAHSEQLNFTAYSAGGGTIGTYVDPTISNLGSDELISLNFSGVSSLEISATDPSTYIMDDLSFEQMGQSVPDTASTSFLLTLSCFSLFFARKYVLTRVCHAR